MPAAQVGRRAPVIGRRISTPERLGLRNKSSETLRIESERSDQPEVWFRRAAKLGSQLQPANEGRIRLLPERFARLADKMVDQYGINVGGRILILKKPGRTRRHWQQPKSSGQRPPKGPRGGSSP